MLGQKFVAVFYGEILSDSNVDTSFQLVRVHYLVFVSPGDVTTERLSDAFIQRGEEL